MIAGGRLDRLGAFVQTTALTGVTQEMRACREHLFAPQPSLTAADDAGR